jgi:hypothetical protein
MLPNQSIKHDKLQAAVVSRTRCASCGVNSSKGECVYYRQFHLGSFNVNWKHEVWRDWEPHLGPPTSDFCKKEYGPNGEGWYMWTGCGCCRGPEKEDECEVVKEQHAAWPADHPLSCSQCHQLGYYCQRDTKDKELDDLGHYEAAEEGDECDEDDEDVEGEEGDEGDEKGEHFANFEHASPSHKFSLSKRGDIARIPVSTAWLEIHCAHWKPCFTSADLDRCAARVPKLTVLHIVSEGGSDDEVGRLARFPALEELRLHGVPMPKLVVTDDDFPALLRLAIYGNGEPIQVHTCSWDSG